MIGSTTGHGTTTRATRLTTSFERARTNSRSTSPLAGFSRDEIAITAEASQLTVTGKKPDKDDTEYLYQGIAARSFERRFNLADYIEVESADFDNGLLHINLVRRIPEKLKPRKIAIGNVTQLEAKGSGKAA